MRTKLVCALSLLAWLTFSTPAPAQDVEDIGEAVGELIGNLFFPQPAAPQLLTPAVRVDNVAPPEEEVVGPEVLDEPIDSPIETVVEAAVVEVPVQAAMALAAPQAPDVDEQVKLLRAQFIQQYQPLLQTELYFLRKVCHPNKDQGKKLTAAGKNALEDAGQKMADVQGKMMRGQFAVFPGNDVYPDPRKVIREGLTVAAKETLTPEQIATYQKELENRIAARKRTMVKYLVAKLDGELALTPDQRAKMVDALTDNWQDAWDQTVEMVMYGENFLPVLPDHLVVNVLTDTQLKIWRTANRNRGAMMGGVGFFPGIAVMNGGVDITEEPWGDEPVDEPVQEEPK